MDLLSHAGSLLRQTNSKRRMLDMLAENKAMVKGIVRTKDGLKVRKGLRPKIAGLSPEAVLMRAEWNVAVIETAMRIIDLPKAA